MTSIVVLSGGVGGARFLRGLRAHLADAPGSAPGGPASALGLPDSSRDLAATAPDSATVTAVVNTGDDMWLSGVRIAPDLDSIMYTLAGENDEVRGWGRVGESERVSSELRAYGIGWPWFTLGDLDIGTHLARTALLRDGQTLTQATARITSRWPLGVRLLPVTDSEVETHVVVEPDDAAEGRSSMHFQEWWTRHRASLPARAFVQHGLESTTATPEVISAIVDADVILVAPSNPVVSIGTILGIPGVREAMAASAAPIVGVSPIIGGAVVRGMADACLSAIGVPTAADAVARHYGARADGGLLDGWLIDEVDASLAPGIEESGIPTRVAPLWMTDVARSARLAGTALDFVRELRARA
ncbi:2-phospho-L-lactate transferase [Galbitalea soli]|uniref:2-phospho-L-lactate transferase n=1 Tax=Galbitalea soli TaxID=1268042 RepID=A0A7C9PNB2_9MICO|nr:2-phospho-L-lactate transferase [Galbitalea soli]NEM91530.1 2-phospho-L-lactate transferase [Galbitalea soli]NYJ30224.1 LPPG:FO 2-phospho-L-lactate transferase [Galbitalea soli]